MQTGRRQGQCSILQQIPQNSEREKGGGGGGGGGAAYLYVGIHDALHCTLGPDDTTHIPAMQEDLHPDSLRKIAEGGNGQVWKAACKQTSSIGPAPVAIKMLLPNTSDEVSVHVFTCTCPMVAKHADLSRPLSTCEFPAVMCICAWLSTMQRFGCFHANAADWQMSFKSIHGNSSASLPAHACAAMCDGPACFCSRHVLSETHI